MGLRSVSGDNRTNYARNIVRRHIPQEFKLAVGPEPVLKSMITIEAIVVKDENDEAVGRIKVWPFPFGKPSIIIMDKSFRATAHDIADAIKSDGAYLFRPTVIDLL